MFKEFPSIVVISVGAFSGNSRTPAILDPSVSHPKSRYSSPLYLPPAFALLNIFGGLPKDSDIVT
jgi:hypothetical protein